MKKLLTQGKSNLFFIHYKLVILLLYFNERRKVLRLNMKKSALTCLEGMKTFILLNLFNIREHKFSNSNFCKPSVSIYVYCIILLFVTRKNIFLNIEVKIARQKSIDLYCFILYS